MARKRMISPEFWTDEKLGECTRDERLLFMGLISNADDEGRGRANVKLVKSSIFPYDDFEDTAIEHMMITLIDKRLVYVYVVDGQQFYWLPSFEKHQTINKPTESRLPEMPEDLQFPEYYRSTTVALPPNRKEEKLREEKGKEDNAQARETPQKPSDFNTFWTAYPKKKSKPDAQKAWNKLKPDEATLALMLSAIAAQKQTPDWTKDNGQYIPHPATWLNGRRWEDDVGPPVVSQQIQRVGVKPVHFAHPPEDYDSLAVDLFADSGGT